MIAALATMNAQAAKVDADEGDTRLAARADVVRRVGHVVGVRVVDDGRPFDVAGEDAVLRRAAVAVLVIRGRCGDVVTVQRQRCLVAATVAVVPPDLVVQRVARRQVLDGDPWRLEREDALADVVHAAGVDHAWVLHSWVARTGGAEIAAETGGLGRREVGAVDDDRVAVHAAQMQVGLVDQDLGGVAPVGRAVALLVIDARADENPVTGLSGVDRRLDRRISASDVVVRADEEDVGHRRVSAIDRSRAHPREWEDHGRQAHARDRREAGPA